jgi:hypothetical protein
MEKNTTPNGFSISGVMCSVFGHHFEVTKQITHHIKEYKCTQCRLEATTDAHGDLATLTPQFRDINKSLSNLYRKKKSRQQLSMH